MEQGITTTSNRGGYREGSGRPPGKHIKTILKEQIQEEMKQRIFTMTHKLITAQSIAAMGTHLMVQILKGPEGKMITKPVREMSEMNRLIDEGVYGVDYIVVVGKDANVFAIDSLLNRAFGKAKETIDLNATIENVAVEDKEQTDKVVWDYLMGKKGITNQPLPKQTVSADNINYGRDPENN